MPCLKLPLHAHVIQIAVHVAFFLTLAIGFLPIFVKSNLNVRSGASDDSTRTGRDQSGDGLSLRDVNAASGPGGVFKYLSNWILGTQLVFFVGAIVYDLLLLFSRSRVHAVATLRFHLDRLFYVQFGLNAGMATFIMIQFWDQLVANDSLIVAHVMPLLWITLETALCPHLFSSVGWLEPAMTFCIVLVWFVHYWTYHALTGSYVYGDPWTPGVFVGMFCLPLVTVIGQLCTMARFTINRKFAACWPVLNWTIGPLTQYAAQRLTIDSTSENALLFPVTHCVNGFDWNTWARVDKGAVDAVPPTATSVDPLIEPEHTLDRRLSELREGKLARCRLITSRPVLLPVILSFALPSVAVLIWDIVYASTN